MPTMSMLAHFGGKKDDKVEDTKMLQPAKRKQSQTVAEKQSKKQKVDKEAAKPAKPVKDKNAPKKPQSAYFQFMNAKRADFMKENPTAKFGEVGKGLAEQWKALTPEEQKPYQEMWEKDKERYAKEMESYTPVAQPDTKVKGKKAKKDPNAPKRPLIPYMLFCNEMRAKVREENPDLPITKLSVILAAKWKEADEETKTRLQKQFEEGKVQYDKDMVAYKAGTYKAPGKEDAAEEEAAAEEDAAKEEDAAEDGEEDAADEDDAEDAAEDGDEKDDE